MSSFQADSNVPLSQLASSLMDASPSPSPVAVSRANGVAAAAHVHHDHADKESCGSGWWAFIFYFLVFALAFYFLYFALRPSFVLNQCHDSRSHSDDHADEEINNGKLLGAAVVSALILLFVLWLFLYCVQCYQ